jgi:hypothetical protein
MPPCEAISYNGEACVDLPQLWEALHGTYNGAAGRPCDPNVLDAIPPLEEREWPPFSHCEMTDALRACSSCSTPGPDHVTWRLLKMILLSDPQCSALIVSLATACLMVGYWPSYFKTSSSVIIPKPGKAAYNTPRAFRPIVLLNTCGKLIEKMVSTRLQFDSVKFGLLHSHQFGGIRQRSTEDAGVFLTHLVKAGWAKGHKTSVIAFDVAQFFPSLNHEFLLRILSQQGFPTHVGAFFTSYLVGRSTSYRYGLESSPFFDADVGVGQGSALSPMLSSIYFSAAMRLFYSQSTKLEVDLLSYVDDGTLVCQARKTSQCLPRLAQAYGIMFQVLSDMGLSMEHSKTELFHFSCEQKNYQDLSISLPVGPNSAVNPLCPKAIWCYLGFFFDRHLTFREHVCHYTTKAFTMVWAMGMLGNSVRGLDPMLKRLLYRSCVVPVATYGCKLWLNPFAKCKGLFDLYRRMQRRTALWITGAFKTSPSGGVESLAGLIPIHLHLEKLVTRASYRVPTLSTTHPIRSLIGAGAAAGDSRHKLHVSNLRPHIVEATKSTISGLAADLSALTERFEADAEECRPGHRLLDVIPDRILFIEFDKSMKDHAVVEGLNGIRSMAGRPHDSALVSTDASVDPKGVRQAASAACVFRQGVRVFSHIAGYGRATSTDAELFAIRIGLTDTFSHPDVNHVTLFTDTINGARHAVNPTPKSGQSHALFCARLIFDWLDANPIRDLTFVHARSALKWDLHKQAHNLSREPRRHLPMGPSPVTTLLGVWQALSNRCLADWHKMFQSPSYRGRNFLNLLGKKDKPRVPTYLAGGSWLPDLGDARACARVCRVILNHAPMGEFRVRYNLGGFCNCEYCDTGARQTRAHLLGVCTSVTRGRMFEGKPEYLSQLTEYLRYSPWLFSFDPYEGQPSLIR